MGLFGGDSKSSSTSKSNAEDRRIAATDEALSISGQLKAEGGDVNLDATRYYVDSRQLVDNSVTTTTDQGAVAAGKDIALDALDLSGQSVAAVGDAQAKALQFGRDALNITAQERADALSAITSNLDTSLNFAKAAGQSADQQIGEKLITGAVVVAVAFAAAMVFRK